MTTLTNSGGRVLTYTNDCLETILLQVNSSNNYYTTGEHDIICIKLSSNKLLRLDHTYYTKRNTFHNHIINECLINPFDLELILDNTSTEYDLHSVYNGNSCIGIITELPRVCLAIYDIPIESVTYTGSENIDITNNQIPLNVSVIINNEIVIHPRSGGVF